MLPLWWEILLWLIRPPVCTNNSKFRSSGHLCVRKKPAEYQYAMLPICSGNGGKKPNYDVLYLVSLKMLNLWPCFQSPQCLTRQAESLRCSGHAELLQRQRDQDCRSELLRQRDHRSSSRHLTPPCQSCSVSCSHNLEYFKSLIFITLIWHKIIYTT